jgi:methylmalonyl-CoA mutase
MSEPPARNAAVQTARFPVPDREAWLSLVGKTLKGEGFETLRSTTRDGVVLEPLYVADATTPRLSARPTPAADPEHPWDLRAVVDRADTSGAAADAVEELENGAASLLLRLDPTGRDGVAVGGPDDLARALSGVILDAAPVALDAGFAGPWAADGLALLAKGAPQARLAFHLDPFSAFAESGTSPGPVESHLIAAAQTVARHAPTYPQATGFLASGRGAHEAGGSDGQELGLMAAAALAYAKAGARAGLSLEQAFAGVVLGLSVDQRYLEGVAKLRAARAIWARLTGACGVAVPPRIEARASRRMLSRLDPWTNLLRLTAAGFGAGVGGAEAVVLEPFTRPLGRPTALARRQARNTQLVLMQEAHVARIADPAGGAGFFEQLTDDLARAGWAVFQAIEARGGVVAALEDGFVAGEVAKVREARATDIASGKEPILGVTLFRDASGAVLEVEPAKAAPAADIPKVRLPGPDSRCPALTPVRLSEGME